MMFLVVLSSCMKEDDAITLPAPGPVKQGTANMGLNYENQVYFDLETGNSIVRPYKNYDLAFEASKNGSHIYLNSAKFMFASNTQSYDMFAADTVGHPWSLDCEQLLDDTLALTKYWQDVNFSTQGSKVFALDRGKLEHTGVARWRKFKVLSVDSLKYTICFSNYDNSSLDTVEIVKDDNYSLMYFSFDTPDQLVQQAPPKDQWDFVFTKYTHVFLNMMFYLHSDIILLQELYKIFGIIQRSCVFKKIQCQQMFLICQLNNLISHRYRILLSPIMQIRLAIIGSIIISVMLVIIFTLIYIL